MLSTNPASTLLATAAGLEALPSVEVSYADLDELPEDLPLPGVAKPHASVTTASDGQISRTPVHLVEDRDDVRRLLEANREISWLIQRRVTGTLAAIGGVAWEGRMVCAVHQISPRIWPPERGITAFARTIAPDAHREKAVAAILSEIGWSGIYGMQFLLVDGKSYPIDLNPRIYGSIPLAIAAGLNLPAIWMDLLLGREPEAGAYRVGTRYRVEATDPRALWAAWQQGRRREAIRGALPHPNTAHAVVSPRDPWPASALLTKLFKRSTPW